MKPLRSLLFTTLAGLAGCSVQYDASDGVGPSNTCSDDDQCAGAAVCRSGVCVTTEADLEGLLVEVRPHAAASYGATTSFMFDPSSKFSLVTPAGNTEPFAVGYDLALPALVPIAGASARLGDDFTLPAGCNLPDRSVPARVTFYRVPPYVGLPFTPTAVTTTQTATGYTFDTELPADTYDIYVEPQAIPGCNDGLPFPPVFFPHQTINSGGALVWELSTPGQLTGTITGFSSIIAADWTVDLVEPTRGLPISTDATLTQTKGGFSVTAQISWHDKATPILRLRPPEGSGKPTVYWSLVTGTGGSQDNPVVSFSVADLVTEPVDVGGQILSDGAGSPATLSIQSASLLGTDAQNAAYSVDGLATDDKGAFEVRLPPGKYDVRAFPTDTSLAVTTWSLEVPADVTGCYCGKGFTLEPKRELSGDAATAAGKAVWSASVSLTPSQAASASYWDDTHYLATVSSRASSAVTGQDGGFRLPVDPGGGGSDLVIQPGEGSNFPWFVRPRVVVHDSASLGVLKLTSPAILTGKATDPTGAPVANADVNAWFPVRKPGGKGKVGTVVLIGTVTTDSDGGYTLVLPSQI